jgi:hypothetical protein
MCHVFREDGLGIESMSDIGGRSNSEIKSKNQGK